ncbi:DUF2721 domain-containing protein [Altericroceibacterium spongiae]|uniref:DUF2721 domain-containing protein n=1 Tax=Altericroceibacterium spongiae TaxID=2320269 RepID=A0A420EJ83_9SPHN|nr:DUF2721 domain-containing protein [Altericroceibacterium spongiae]RKF20616.1 DUF2721 domain-containing protein [Altericroceibacterium spongiae]
MIAETIQLALAPVFMLVAIGNIMNLLSTRLGRVVDRSRNLQERHEKTSGSEHDAVVREIRFVARRIQIISKAIRVLVVSALFVGLVVALLFLEVFAGMNLYYTAPICFLVAVSLLMWALLLFLRETREAMLALQIPESYMEWDRTL